MLLNCPLKIWVKSCLVLQGKKSAHLRPYLWEFYYTSLNSFFTNKVLKSLHIQIGSPVYQSLKFITVCCYPSKLIIIISVIIARSVQIIPLMTIGTARWVTSMAKEEGWSEHRVGISWLGDNLIDGVSGHLCC